MADPAESVSEILEEPNCPSEEEDVISDDDLGMLTTKTHNAIAPNLLKQQDIKFKPLPPLLKSASEQYQSSPDKQKCPNLPTVKVSQSR